SALAPLAGVQADVSVVSGLSIPTANGGAVPSAGPGDDFPVAALSPPVSGLPLASDPPSAAPASGPIGAPRIPGDTPFKSLVYRVQVEWSLSVSAPYGRESISYKANPAGGKPLIIQPVVSPKMAFDALFNNFTPPNDAAAAAKQDFLLRSRKSVLDLVGA